MLRLKWLRLILILLSITCVFSSCELLFEMGEFSELGELGAAGEMIEISPEAEAAGMRYGVEINDLRKGRFVIEDQAAAYSLYEDVRIDRIAGENPKLYVEGVSKPIGEVLTNEQRIKFANGSIYLAEENIFSVIGDEVIVRAEPAATSEIIARVKHNHMVVELRGVNDGWYQVNIMKNSLKVTGYVKGNLLAPVILIDSAKLKDFTNSLTDFSNHYYDPWTKKVPYPDLDKIKYKLIGSCMTNWCFKSMDEIKYYDVWMNYSNADSFAQNADLKLENLQTGKQYGARVNIVYKLAAKQKEYVFSHITQEYFAEISNPVNNSRNPSSKSNSVGTFTGPYSNRPNSRISNGLRGSLKMQISDHRPFTLALDGKYVNRNSTSLTVGNIPADQHFIQIYSYSANPQGKGGGYLLYQGNIQIFENTLNTYFFNTATHILEVK